MRVVTIHEDERVVNIMHVSTTCELHLITKINMKYKTTETTFFTEQTNTNADFLWVLVRIFGM